MTHRRTQTAQPRPGAPLVKPPEPTRRKPRAKPETSVKHAIRKALGANPESHVVWLHVGGAIVTAVSCPHCNLTFGVHDHAASQVLDAGLGTGTGDLLGLVDGGRFFQCEVKADGAETPEQARRRQLINRLGGYAVVVHSPEDACVAASRARDGLPAPREPNDPAEPAPAPAALRHCLTSESVAALRVQYWQASAHVMALRLEALCANRDVDTVLTDAGYERMDDARNRLRLLGVTEP